MNFIKTALLLALVAPSVAFQPPATTSRAIRKTGTQQTSLVILESTKDKKKKGGFDEGLRTKLVSESIAPWRTLRLFLYGSLGSGAAVGGFITLAGTAAALSGARTDVDLNTEVSSD